MPSYSLVSFSSTSLSLFNVFLIFDLTKLLVIINETTTGGIPDELLYHFLLIFFHRGREQFRQFILQAHDRRSHRLGKHCKHFCLLQLWLQILIKYLCVLRTFYIKTFGGNVGINCVLKIEFKCFVCMFL